MTWGDEFKLRKGSTDLSVIKADASDIFLEESHDVRATFGPGVRQSAILVKLDANMHEVFRKEFDHEMKGKDFEQFFFIENKLYLFAEGYEKRDRTQILYAVELDKNSGNLKGDWQQVYSWDMSAKGADVEVRITPNADTSRIVIASTNTARTQNSFEILVLDANLKAAGKAFTITNEFDAKTYQLEDFIYSTSGNSMLVGRVYDYEEGKKKKEKNLVFTNYDIRIYDNQGKQIKALTTDIDGKFLVSSKLIQVNKQVILAAYYSNEKKRRQINGMLIERIDPVTGNILGTTKKELTNSLIADSDDGDEKSSRKKKDDDDGLAANLVFRNVYETPDNGLVILSEQYTDQIVTTSSTVGGMNGSARTTFNDTYEDYTSRDMYISKISAQGNIDWLEVLPKRQWESITLGGSSYTGMAAGTQTVSYFKPTTSGRPFYSGFGCIPETNTLHIFFNDDVKNADVTGPVKKIRMISDLGISDCFHLKLDIMTGKLTRTSLFSNKKTPTAMPRLGVIFNNSMYIVGKDSRRSKVVVGKLTL